MSPITTHVLDTSLGKPAEGVAVKLFRLGADGAAQPVGEATTNGDGRAATLLEPGRLEPGVYRLVFDPAAYFAASGRETFYQSIEIAFRVADASQHYHVPLLLSPFGYSTYRGS